MYLFILDNMPLFTFQYLETIIKAILGFDIGPKNYFQMKKKWNEKLENSENGINNNRTLRIL